MAAPKMTKNQMRRAKKKEKKAQQQTETPSKPDDNQDEVADGPAPAKDDQTEKRENTSAGDLAVQKVPDALEKIVADEPVDEDDPTYAMYKDIFEKFGTNLDGDEIAKEANAGNQGEVFFDQDDDIPSEDEEAGQRKLSKKKRKQLSTLSIAELKALVKNPEVVEWHDVSSSDPRLLVQIKAQRNVVPVPSHWSLKREYLSSKRGIEKPPFKLPQFIAETGITEMRDAVLEKQAEQTLKQKQRERVQPKMGKLDIDYQKLYDAFFRFQTKPELTRFGEVYYEGKEWEADFKVFKPGELSEALREALGMQPGFPPPWLLQQQRVGPPPSYPALKIPGLNAPIPAGASWGFQPGQWGKPPLDEYNRPLYGGDLFGLLGQPNGTGQPGVEQPQAPVVKEAPAPEQIDRTLWGELQPPAEESEEEEEDEDEEEEEEDENEDQEIPDSGFQTSASVEPRSGYASTVMDHGSGVETSMAGEFDLRKNKRGYETEESSTGRAAYQVIQERNVRAEGFFGSDKTYDLSRAQGPVLGADDDGSRKRKKPGDVEVALDPDALSAQGGISKDEMRRRYEAGRREEGPGAQWSRSAYEEDLSDMIAQESRKRQKRDEEKKGEKKFRF